LPVWSRTIWKPVVVPGGMLLLAVAVLVHSGWLALPLPAFSFLYYCGLAGGALLAWRFHSSRIFFALVVLFLAQQATSRFDAVHAAPGSPGWTALQAAWLLVPLNFVAIALIEERGYTVAGAAPIALFLFVQSVVVAVLCGAESAAPSLAARAHHASIPVSLPGYGWFALAAAAVLLLVRTMMTRKPADGALLWALGASSLAVQFLGTPRISTAYWAASAWILAASIVENSYLLAYHDELTALPSRRAFNHALLQLEAPYAIAVADIDHFKRFNDTYGHDTGDQVLRLVAGRLARVTGGGQAYRCGGEEFAIVFPGRTVPEVIDHLERLRAEIETAEFRLRGRDRRQVPRGPDRRSARTRRRVPPTRTTGAFAEELRSERLSVTISIGVAAATTEKSSADLVLQAADKALYRAKANGRNRVEAESSHRRRPRPKAAGIA